MILFGILLAVIISWALGSSYGARRVNEAYARGMHRTIAKHGEKATFEDFTDVMLEELAAG